MHDLINDVLLFAAATSLVCLKKWTHLKWTIAFAFLEPLGFTIQNFMWPESYPVFSLVRFGTYFLFLGAIEEILRKDFSKNSRWAVLVFAVISWSLIFTQHYGISYFFPRIVFYVAASLIIVAIKAQHIPLIALSTYSAGLFVADLLKIPLWNQIQEIVLVQRLIDQSFETLLPLVILGAVWLPLLHRQFTLGLMQTPLATTGNISIFPGSGGKNVLDPDHSTDFKELEIVMMAAAKTAEISKKEFLTKQDVELLLDLTPLEVELWLQKNDIKPLTTIKDKWVVSRKDVMKSIDLEEE